jgi:DNA-directed RNA polymerase specialized sigma24 family protein
MIVITCQPEISSIDLFCDATWIALERLLKPLVKKWVYEEHVASWRGQEHEVVGDVVQTTLRKTFEYALNAQQQNIAVTSLERLSMVIARNQLRDQRRKDSRLLRIEYNPDTPEAETFIFFIEDDPADSVLERHFEAWIFCQVAKAVLLLPKKERLAMLIHLAHRMEVQGAFYGQPTPLRQAFLDEGIDLEEYIHLLPIDLAAKARHSSLVSLGYKRIAKLVGNIVDQT